MPSKCPSPDSLHCYHLTRDERLARGTRPTRLFGTETRECCWCGKVHQRTYELVPDVNHGTRVGVRIKRTVRESDTLPPEVRTATGKVKGES